MDDSKFNLWRATFSFCFVDGFLSQEEQGHIEEVKTAVLSKLNMQQLNQTIADDEKASYHEDEVYKIDNKSSYTEAVIKSLLKALNPGDYKFPKN